ncbi:hypothetical protein Nepgr_026068 [Nepenthes gracilis]|uniref:Uncharacterized protein n=1 Tax=Nepenthes gracilis TaxID=150966 RepID=A0AAD3Y1Q1_NEPGR|nr:hypothetical protein Nepgr_026068 [Nepenthes gracilis]
MVHYSADNNHHAMDDLRPTANSFVALQDGNKVCSSNGTLAEAQSQFLLLVSKLFINSVVALEVVARLWQKGSAQLDLNRHIGRKHRHSTGDLNNEG